MDFYDRTSAAARILSTPGISFAEAMEQFLDEYPTLKVDEARKWLNKALEIIRTGVPLDMEHAKRKYVGNLEWFISTCRKKLIEDVEEITTTVENDGTDEPAEGESAEATVQPKTIKRKVKRQVLNPQIGSLLLKAMKEHATVTGARPKDGARNVNVTQNNVQIGASKLSEQSNQQLLDSLGITNAKVLPEPEVRSHPVVADAESVPIDIEVGDE